YTTIASYSLEFLAGSDPKGFEYVVPSSLLAGGGLVLALYVRPSGSFVGKIGNLLGDASYSIYLTHFVPLLIMLELSRRVAIPGGQAIPLVAFVIVAVVFGCCIHYAIERPLITWTREMMKKRRYPAKESG